MNAEIEAFCEKQILPTRNDLLLLVGELLMLFQRMSALSGLDLTISYSERTGRLEIVCEASGAVSNPLEQEDAAENLGLMIVRNLTESSQFRCEDGRSILELKMTPLTSGATIA